MALCARASVTVIDTYPDWDGNVTQSYLRVAQSFMAPADNTLANWRFTLAPSGGQTNVLFEVVAWDTNSGPSGPLLFSRQVSWPSLGGDVLVDNINLALTPASDYAVVVDLEGYAGKSVEFQYNQNSYPQGNASWYAPGLASGWKYLNSTYNTAFQAEFYVVPEPAHLLGVGLVTLFLTRGSRRPL